MAYCYDCGNQYKSREKDGEFQVYDSVAHEWTLECPNCGSEEFDDDDD